MAKPKLLERVRTEIRRRNYSYRTEQAYVQWMVRFVRFNNLTHPQKLAEQDVVRFLNWLANEREVAASTQNQALCAIVFLYKHILDQPLGQLNNLKRAKESQHIPVVLSAKEARRILLNMQGIPLLMTELLYGSGLRQSECLRLRINDIDFEYNQIWVRNGKGAKDRATIMPLSCKDKLRDRVKKVKTLHDKDIALGYGAVILPNALALKYPGQTKALGWQYLFPSTKRSKDPRSGQMQRYHRSPSYLHKAIKRAVRRTNIVKKVEQPYLPPFVCHAFIDERLRHPYRPRTAGP